ncbi:cyclin-I isoform X2 [Latimeria chalumnae]|uniref:cyclin-I isoform X2 n=1 Tax=Latimeria chalumnae TaxID=7897 RepID=UPI0003C15631|nr:PREDICTED: cyclin-I isoform X2 [Latimeria chalumnae]|eukprot:XP_006010660.1 PREDICTED: cyclin-I isoform X2 [Latimeria chalumnae]
MDRMITESDWETHHRFAGEDTDISPAQRDEAVRWLVQLNNQFHLYPETLALAVSILDRFLAIVKARPKYLRCMAISCFFLAVKTREEDERIPILKELAKESCCGCSPAEILRMERIILDKLSWDLHTATPLDFLHIFHAMAMSSRPQLLASCPQMNPSQHVAVLTRQLHQCIACHQLLSFKGSLLALAVISLEMEKLIPDWLALTIELIQKAQIDSSQLIHCQELVAHHLSISKASLPPNAVYIYSPFKQTMVPCESGALRRRRSLISELGFPSTKDNGKPEVSIRGTTAPYRRLPPPVGCRQTSAKRKVEDMEVDAFYDGIKRLYNEDSAQEAPGMESAGSVCGANLSWQEGSVSPCPPLQPVAVV